jgi:hypothetical protein
MATLLRFEPSNRADFLERNQGTFVPWVSGLSGSITSTRRCVWSPLQAGGSQDGGLNEFLELSLRRSSNSAIRRSRRSKAVRRAA